MKSAKSRSITAILFVVSAIIVAGVFAYTTAHKKIVSAAIVENKITMGMSVAVVESALGQPPGTYARRIQYFGEQAPKESRYAVALTEENIGAWFAPQERIVLYLDKNKRITSGSVKTIFRIDDPIAPLALRPAPPVVDTGKAE